MTNKVLKVGILHSLTGALALSEKPLVNAALLAIDEVNEAGGVLGHRVEAIVRDGNSDSIAFALEAEKLVTQDQVVSIFGCWTSASRKAVKGVVEKHHSLLWYPIQYEGLEQSPSIIYTGQCLNQQIEPAVNWTLSIGKRKFLLIGSDYIFPHVANDKIRTMAEEAGAEVLADSYVPLGSSNVSKLISAIKSIQPDAIFNSINGDANIAFFRALAEAGLKPDKIPVVSFSFSENELQQVALEAEGHYACWSYFDSFGNQENLTFKKALKEKYGKDHPVSEPVVNAYVQVHLWRQIVEAIGTPGPSEVARQAPGHRISGPAGEIEILPNHHVRKYAFIGCANPAGSFDVIWQSDKLIDPKPWLGIEDYALPRKTLIKKALGLYPDYVYLSNDLEKRGSFLNTILADMSEGVVVTDSQNRIVLMNPPAEALCKHKESECLGKDADEVLPLKKREVEEYLSKLATGKDVAPMTVEAGGRTFSVGVRRINIAGVGEQGIVRVVRDITESLLAERALSEAALEWQTTFDSIRDGICIIASDCKIIRSNKAFADTFGDTAEAMIGRLCHEVVHKRNTPVPGCPHQKTCLTGNPETLEIFEPTLNRYIEVSTSPVYNNKDQFTGSIHVTRDITERKKMEEALRDSEARYRAIVGNMQGGVVVVDKSTRAEYANSKAMEILGYPFEEMSRMTTIDYVAPEERPRIGQVLLRWRTSNDPVVDADCWVVRKDGARRYLHVRTSRLEGMEKSLLVLNDITTRKEMEEALRESEERYRDLFENANDLIQSVAPDGHFVYVNRAWRDTLGYAPEEISRLSMFDVIHPDSRAHCEEVFRRVLSEGKAERVEAVFVTRDGRNIIVEGNANCKYVNSKPVNTRAIFRDVTERKRLEAQLHEKVRELGEANERLKELDKLKDDFLSTVSHELRTPLTSIKGYVDLVLDGEAGEITEQQKAFLDIARSNTDRQIALINDLLDVSRITSGRIQLKIRPISVKEVVQGSVLIMRTHFEKKEQKVILDLPDESLTALGDWDRITQVLTNLLSNAHKFSPEGATISVTARKVDDCVQFDVTDTGIGISKADQTKLFTKFFRADNAMTREAGGTGLGLSITKSIVEMHHGNIWVESKSGKGSTFSFTLPGGGDLRQT